jgi:hypothetical protein
MSAKIKEMDATDLVGRLVINPNGVEFRVTKLTLEASSGQVLIWVDELDTTMEDEGRTIGRPAGLPDLDGWEIHQHLLRRQQ